MKNSSVLLVATALAGTLGMGCGDDDAAPVDGGASDASTVRCPDNAPAPDNQMGTCCSRASNAGQLMMPELRIAAIDLESPASLANPLVGGLLVAAFNEERFNWIMRFDLSDMTNVAVTTGYGERNTTDGTFAFVMDGAPGMPTNRWDPQTIGGGAMSLMTLSGETITGTGNYDGTVTVPVFDEMDELLLELPLRGLRLTNLEFTEDRSCVGLRRPSSYVTTSGSLTAYIKAEDADRGVLVVGDAINTTLCNFIAGRSTASGMTCADFPDQTMWCTGTPCATSTAPDSICTDAGVCTTGGCTPSTTWPPAAGSCNAWQLGADFAAQGVDITN